jgi:hypothetical protein
MKLICDCDTGGHDVSCYAVLEMDEGVAQELLSRRAAFQAAQAACRDTYRVVLFSAISPDYFWEDLPEDLAVEQMEDLQERLCDAPGEFVTMPESWPGGLEPMAHTEVECCEALEEGVCFTAIVGDLEVETARIGWAELEAVVGGTSPWAAVAG